MKKYFSIWSAIILLIVSVGFSSCNNDDDVITGNIVGKWNLITATVNGVSEPVNGCFVEIRADGTFLEYSGVDNRYTVGDWVFSNGKLAVYPDNERTWELFPDQGKTYQIPISFTVTRLDSRNLTLRATVLGFEIVNNYTRE